MTTARPARRSRCSRRTRTSATCSTPRASPGAGSRAGSRRRRPKKAKRSCGSSHKNVGGETVADYSAHHEPFQYYAVDGQPAPPAAELAEHDRAQRPGQPPVRPVLVLHRAAHGRAAVGVAPEGGQVPGRPRRLLRPAGRAGVSGARDQRTAELARLVEHGGRDRLRRLRRLLRPRAGADRQLLGLAGRSAERPGQVRQRHARGWL